MSRETHIAQAKLAEQAERFEDMVVSMKALTSLGGQLSPEERNLLSVAYKNVVATRRSSWRVVTSIETKSNEKRSQQAAGYRAKIASELNAICKEVVV
jgi:hypothetical protein